MKKSAYLLIILALGATWAVAQAAYPVVTHTPYPVVEKEQIQKTLEFRDTSRPGSLSLDNVWGSITVEATSGREVGLAATRTIRAESKDKLEKAKSEVKLDISETADGLEIYVDGPFRCHCQDGHGRKDRDLGYEVAYDFVLKVPRSTHLKLKTITDGNILVRGVQNGFKAQNVNGGVKLVDVAGAGEARTVNGNVTVDFVRNPEADCSFSTVSGRVELGFQPRLSADFRLKSFTGEALTDFELKSLPDVETAAQRSEKGGRFVYKRDRFTRVRAGQGGPLITCETLSGKIIIKKYEAR
jgi:hypothetical protein